MQRRRKVFIVKEGKGIFGILHSILVKVEAKINSKEKLSLFIFRVEEFIKTKMFYSRLINSYAYLRLSLCIGIIYEQFV